MIDLRGLEIDLKEREARRLVRLEAERAFNLSQAPAIRTALIKLAPQEHLLLLTLHHIIGDEWSMQILVKEVAAFYSASAENHGSLLEPLPIQYADYAAWERGPQHRATVESQIEYWKNQLHGMRRLEWTKRKSMVQDAHGGREYFQLSVSLMNRVRALSKRYGVTLFMTLLAAFKCVLSQSAQTEDIAVGTDVAGRTRLEIEGLIGFFVNQLVMRTNLGQDPTFGELLQRVSRVALEAYSHQDVPFERIVQELRPKREPGRNPLYGVKLVLQNTPGDELVMSELKWTQIRTPLTTARFDLALVIDDSGAEASGTAAYNSDLYDKAEAQRVVHDYISVLEQVTLNPEIRLSELIFTFREVPPAVYEFAGARDLASPIDL